MLDASRSHFSTDAKSPDRPLRLFISYAPADSALRKELEAQLAGMKRQHLIEPWHDQLVEVGTEIASSVRSHIESADLILILISANYLSSDKHYAQELLPALRRHESGQAALVPILISSVDWRHTPVAAFSMLPSGERPIDLWRNRSEAWLDVERAVSAIVQSMRGGVPAVPVLPAQIRDWIEDKTADFTGREHIFAAIDDFCKTHDRGYVLIQGDPGFGKSAILAEYIRRNRCVAHCNVRAQGIAGSRQFLESAGRQLSERFVLPYRGSSRHDGAWLAEMLAQCAQKLVHGSRLVLAVDALDEADFSAQSLGTNLLFLPQSLPRGVYFVVTHRPVRLPLRIDTAQQLIDLGGYPEDNIRDTRAYLAKVAQRPQLRAWLEQRHLESELFVNTLVEKSQTNFMYLRYVLADIEAGQYNDLLVTNLPVGLTGYYEDHWRRMGMQKGRLSKKKINLVYILSEAREPLSRRQLAQFSKIDDVTAQAVLDEWRQFLHQTTRGQDTQYAIYHSSFRDFLHRQDIVKSADVEFKDIHKQISDALDDPLSEDALDRFLNDKNT